MYIHGFIDEALVVIAFEVVALVVTAVVYSKKKVNSSNSGGAAAMSAVHFPHYRKAVLVTEDWEPEQGNMQIAHCKSDYHRWKKIQCLRKELKGNFIERAGNQEKD